MTKGLLHPVTPELVKQARDVNDLCHAAFNFFWESAESERRAGEYRSSRIKRTVWGIILTVLASVISMGIGRS